MVGAGLRIDTSVVAQARLGSSSERSAIRERSLTPGSAYLKQAHSPREWRSRRASTASTSSSLSVISPNSSSTNASPTSPHFHNDQTSSISSFHPSTYSPESPTSPLLDETLRLTSEYVLAMHDYFPQQQNATCLSFRAGQVIHVLNRDVSGWWDGELEGRRGWFPSNYVNAEVDCASLIEEELPRKPRKRGHAYSVSTTSATSWAGTSSEDDKGSIHQWHSPSQSPAPDIESYCPRLMIPLLHALSLLQGAVRGDRVSHFQPSTSCMISCVRSILSSTDCLPREAPLLQQFPILAQERKRILSSLASLVAQAKKASEDQEDLNENRQSEVDDMLRLGGHVFAHVRRFLSIAIQCGIELPEPRHTGDSGFDTTSTEAFGSNGSTPISPEASPVLSTSPTSIRRMPFETPKRPGNASRAKSMFDLRQQRKLDIHDDSTTPAPHRTLLARLKSRPLLTHRPALPSFSSISSSSVESLEETIMPAAFAFPSGPATTSQVMDALRRTHDQYLSTIAAFIGHAQAHTRMSHASSTGHMYDLVREVVEMACKLLTIVEAVMAHPDVPFQKVGNLRSAKEGLYNVTSSLAESVRQLTASQDSETSEEEEKANLLRSATGALKAAADCVAAVKMCLNRSIGERAFIINLPIAGEGRPDTFVVRDFTTSPLWKSSSMADMHISRNAEEGDVTNQGGQTMRAARNAREPHGPKDGLPLRRSAETTPVDQEKTLLPRIEEQQPLLSPSDEGASWEDAQKDLPPGAITPMEERLLNDGLTATSLESAPELHPDPVSWMLSHDYPVSDVAYNSEGNLVGATIEVLVEKMTPHDTRVDTAFASVFFLTFRLFSSPAELVEAVISRYNLPAPQNVSPEAYHLWEQRKCIPVRLRVSNFLKTWLETHWRPLVDNVVLPTLMAFVRHTLAITFPAPSQRILELCQIRSTTDANASPKGDRLRDLGIPMKPLPLPSSENPRPTMTKTLLSTLRRKDFPAISVTDFDALELARQMTIMECKLYGVIQPEEILDSGREGAKPPVNVKAVSTLSTTITGWVAESILNEPDLKKRQGLVKFFIKVADRCSTLNNFSTSRSILAALDSSTISRLHQTWTGVPQKNKLQLETLRRLADHSRNYHEYRSRLRNTVPPAVPFLGLYLTDIIFCREGNPSYRPSPLVPEKKLINYNKYQKLARIVQDLQRFQYPYNLKEIPEVQQYLNVAFENARHHGDLQDLYRRSLLVEPRQPADAPPTSDVRQLFNWATRSQPQANAS